MIMYKWTEFLSCPILQEIDFPKIISVFPLHPLEQTLGLDYGCLV